MPDFPLLPWFSPAERRAWTYGQQPKPGMGFAHELNLRADGVWAGGEGRGIQRWLGQGAAGNQEEPGGLNLEDGLSAQPPPLYS